MDPLSVVKWSNRRNVRVEADVEVLIQRSLAPSFPSSSFQNVYKTTYSRSICQSSWLSQHKSGDLHPQASYETEAR